MPDIYFSDTKSKAVFSAEGPKPQFLFDTPQFKALVVGLEAGGQIPYHPGEAAMYIGWEAGNPFQLEVAGANLAVGLLGFGGFWRRDFWLPYVISKTAFLWVAGITHIIDLVNHNNFSSGNAGLTLYMDFIWPMIYIGLLFLLQRYGRKPPAGAAFVRPQILLLWMSVEQITTHNSPSTYSYA